MRPEAVANVLQEAERGRPDLAGIPQITVKGDLTRDALRITRRHDRTGIDAAGMCPEEAAVLAEKFAQQWVRERGQVPDGANPDAFQPERSGRPAAWQLPERQW